MDLSNARIAADRHGPPVGARQRLGCAGRLINWAEIKDLSPRAIFHFPSFFPFLIWFLSLKFLEFKFKLKFGLALLFPN
jgi:hypothetical protein